MTSSLLETKFYAPGRRSGLVPRPHLTDRLHRGTQSRLTLVSAPAGFGKSTLLAEWLAAAPPDGSVTAWLSLDPSDNHPVVFWTHLIAALQAAAPGVGASALSLLESPERSIEAVLAPLLNELNAVPNDIVLVLDDYHAIDAHEIQAGMAFMLEHLPAQVHLVIATRADPAVPLARLRSRSELVAHLPGHHRLHPACDRPAHLPRRPPANQIVVCPTAGSDFVAVASANEATVDNSATLTGAEFNETVGATTMIFNRSSSGWRQSA